MPAVADVTIDFTALYVAGMPVGPHLRYVVTHVTVSVALCCHSPLDVPVTPLLRVTPFTDYARCSPMTPFRLVTGSNILVGPVGDRLRYVVGYGWPADPLPVALRMTVTVCCAPLRTLLATFTVTATALPSRVGYAGLFVVIVGVYTNWLVPTPVPIPRNYQFPI